MQPAYKYCSARGVGILENLEIKVTPPNQFNDPFEFTPHIIWSNPRARATSILRSKTHMRTLYDMLKAEGRFKGSFGKFHKNMRERPLTRQKLAKGLSEYIPLSAATVQREQEILAKASARFGILCLSQRRDSILMWGHYCDKHSGLVIGFDESNDLFHPKGDRALRPVNYVRERVLFDATWEESDPRIIAFEDQMTFSKNEDWRYEQELRQMFELSSLKSRSLDDGTPGYFLSVPAPAVLTVTLGARCSRETQEKVRLALRRPEFSHVKRDRAVLHESEFAMRFE